MEESHCHLAASWNLSWHPVLILRLSIWWKDKSGKVFLLTPPELNLNWKGVNYQLKTKIFPLTLKKKKKTFNTNYNKTHWKFCKHRCLLGIVFLPSFWKYHFYHIFLLPLHTQTARMWTVILISDWPPGVSVERRCSTYISLLMRLIPTNVIMFALKCILCFTIDSNVCELKCPFWYDWLQLMQGELVITGC